MTNQLLLLSIIPALILVESGKNPNAVGRDGEQGILQITPIMYREYKRLGGTLPPKAVQSPMKSKQIAHRVLSRRIRAGYDPISEACRIWNPGAGKNYETKVRKALK